MRKKDGRFIPSLALALVAHAVLFLCFALLVARSPVVTVAPQISLVEVQISGSGGGGGNDTPVARPAPVRKAPVKSIPAPPAPAATPAPIAAAQPLPQAEPAADTQAAPAPQATTGETSHGTGGTGGPGSGSGSGGTGDGSAGASETGPTDGPPASIADIDPVPIRAIAVAYPSSARRLGQEGLVKVQAEIDNDGIVTDGRVSVSSGFGSLDDAALDAVRKARFMPAMKNGRPVASKIIIPIRFHLKQE